MTVEQKQCLLKYLGYYTGKVDDIWGPGSEQATRELQAASGITEDCIFGGDTLESAKDAVANDRFKVQPQEPEAGDFWAGIPNFRQKEFACKCGCGFDDIDQGLVSVIQRVRDHFGGPGIVSSGCRCPEHNVRVGGATNSRHLRGRAVDFSIRGRSSQEVLAYVQQQPEIRYSYAIDGSYVHMDVGS